MGNLRAISSGIAASLFFSAVSRRYFKRHRSEIFPMGVLFPLFCVMIPSKNREGALL